MSSTKKALEKYFEREHKKLQREMTGPKRKNKSPEKKVVKDILEWGKKYGLDLDVIEASGYDRIKKAMVHDTKIDPGYPDISGNDRFGLAVYIEAKAKGRRSSLRDHQRQFLMRKINSGAFACVADSAEYVHELYHKWLVCKLRVRELSVLRPMMAHDVYIDEKNPTRLLLDSLPKLRKQKVQKKSSGNNELDSILE